MASILAWIGSESFHDTTSWFGAGSGPRSQGICRHIRNCPEEPPHRVEREDQRAQPRRQIFGSAAASAAMMASLEKSNNSRDLAGARNNLAAFYQRQQRFTDAEPRLKRALAIRETTLPREHPDAFPCLAQKTLFPSAVWLRSSEHQSSISVANNRGRGTDAKRSGKRKADAEAPERMPEWTIPS